MIESFIDNSKRSSTFTKTFTGIMIAVTEAVNNAIKHGNKSNSEKNVTLSLSLTENVIKFKIEDQGAGFNYHNLPDPTAPENLEKPSGRGIFLMKHLADEVAFHDEGRIVELFSTWTSNANQGRVMRGKNDRSNPGQSTSIQFFKADVAFRFQGKSKISDWIKKVVKREGGKPN